MHITFADSRLEKDLNDMKAMVRKYGTQRASKLGQRLGQLADASSLADFRNLPGRCHELKGQLKGQLALDLDGPYRLLFEPAHEPVPKTEDGGLDWGSVTRVKILEIVDYHG